MVPLGCGKLVLRYHIQVLTPPSMSALKWMFTFKVLLSSAKPTQQLTQYPGFKFSSENTCCAVRAFICSVTCTCMSLDAVKLHAHAKKTYNHFCRAIPSL